MRLKEARRRLPIVDALPPSKGRRYLPQAAEGVAVPTPSLAVWELTLACDHRCLHCGPRAGQARPDELSTDEALALVAELAELGVGEVVLIGGEAYLRNDFILIARAIRDAGMACTMTTGGLGLTRARADAMVEAGIQSVNVSIDGLAETHDHVRNRQGSWKRAFAALANVKAAGGRICVNTQINRRSRHELPQLLEHLAEAGISAWQLQITCAHGNAVENADIVLQPYDYPALFEMLDDLVVRARELGIIIWPGNNLGYFGPVERNLRREQKRYSGHFTGCHAGKRTISIESNGMIKNCPSLGGAVNTGGNVREHSLAELWARAPELTYFRHRTVDDLWGYCRDCYYAETCMGGCTAASEPLLGRPGNNPFCYHRAQEMARQGLRERIELVRGADPDTPFSAGLFRVVREHADPELRARHGVLSTDEPRVGRDVEREGAGRPIDASAQAPAPDTRRTLAPSDVSRSSIAS